MQAQLDETLQLWLDVDVRIAKGFWPEIGKRTLRKSVLMEYEERGFASRHLRTNGTFGWRATPRMHDYLRDAEQDAIDDREASI